MKNYQICAKQIIQNRQPCGYITLCHYDYGYKVEMHLFTIPGGLYTKYFQIKDQAIAYMDKLYNEYNC